MKLGELGSIQEYNVYCTSEELDTSPEYDEPVFLVAYDEMITPTFFGIGNNSEILEQDREIEQDNDNGFHKECRICESDISHLHEMYWVQAQMVTYDSVMEDHKWAPLKNSCIPICPRCEKIIYQFTEALLEEHSSTLVQSRL